MDGLKYCVKHGHGKYNLLDKAYNKFISEIIINGDDKALEQWETYNIIIMELLSSNKIEYFDEVRYRLTGKENPNMVILDIINKDDETKELLNIYLNTIEYWCDLDIMKEYGMI